MLKSWIIISFFDLLCHSLSNSFRVCFITEEKLVVPDGLEFENINYLNLINNTGFIIFKMSNINSAGPNLRQYLTSTT